MEKGLVKKFLIITTFLYGCAIETTSEEIEEVAHEDAHGSIDSSNTRPNEVEGCGFVGKSIDLNGEEYILRIPVLCSPLYIYKGYPDDLNIPDQFDQHQVNDR